MLWAPASYQWLVIILRDPREETRKRGICWRGIPREENSRGNWGINQPKKGHFLKRFQDNSLKLFSVYYYRHNLKNPSLLLLRGALSFADRPTFLRHSCASCLFLSGTHLGCWQQQHSSSRTKYEGAGAELSVVHIQNKKKTKSFLVRAFFTWSFVSFLISRSSSALSNIHHSYIASILSLLLSSIVILVYSGFVNYNY